MHAISWSETTGDEPVSITRASAADIVESAIMTRARARLLWLAGPRVDRRLLELVRHIGNDFSVDHGHSRHRRRDIADHGGDDGSHHHGARRRPQASEPTSSTSPPPSTAVPVDPSILIPIAVGNKPFPADGDELATLHHGYTGDPNATLQAWLITPMAVPSGPDVRLLGFERSVGNGVNSTTATFMTGRDRS